MTRALHDAQPLPGDKDQIWLDDVVFTKLDIKRREEDLA